MEFFFFLPLIADPIGSNAPIPSWSYYIKDISPASMYSSGCELSSQLLNTDEAFAFAALIFGQPWIENGVYGVRHYGFGFPFISTAQVAAAATSFATGYANCSIISPNNTRLVLGIGVTNQDSAMGEFVTLEHGEAWNQMISVINDNFDDTIIEFQVFTVGAADMEPDFNTAENTTNWVLGFTDQGTNPLYNLGTADGCPYEDVPGIFDGLCGTINFPNWNQSDVWFISAGRAQLRVFPQIYSTNGVNAQQWYQIALYGIRTEQLFSTHFEGALTQFTACEQRNTDEGCLASNPYLKNSPEAGWDQLNIELNNDPQTVQNLPYSSDIQYQGEPTPVP